MPVEFEQRDGETFEQWWDRVNALFAPQPLGIIQTGGADEAQR